ncbi:MAG: TRAP transporter permease [Oceanobacter sp.]
MNNNNTYEVFLKGTRNLVMAGLAGFAIYVAGFGVFDTTLVYGISFALALLGGLLYLAQKNAREHNGLGMAKSAAHMVLGLALVALTWHWVQLMLEQEEFFIEMTRQDYLIGWGCFAIIGYLTYRHFGLTMLLVYLAAIGYAAMPTNMGGGGLHWEAIADRQFYSTDGIFGLPIQVVATVVLVFIAFGAVLQTSGAGEVLLKMAFAATGRFSGGPAHASIVGSAMFGTMSGAAVANVVSTGVFTIPIIKRAGFSPRFAGGVEAAASTGGQIMPPVMGVVAFIMADVTSIPYLHIIVAAAIPAAFYYLSLFLVVLVEARKEGLKPTPPEKREVLTRSDWLKSLCFWIPLGIIITVLLTGRTAQNAGFYSLIAATVLSLIFFPNFRHPKQWWAALVNAGKTCSTLLIVVAAVGLIIGIVNMTGIGLSFADAIRALSGDSEFFALVLVMVACLLMGMGVPSVTAYLILALVMGPVLEMLGVPKIAAHLFIMYFGVLSVVTPPVALAAFAAAPIAQAGPMQTAVTAVRLSIAGFIIPFLFVYRPELLLIEGYTVAGLSFSIFCFLVATWMITTGLARYERARLSNVEALARLALAFAILHPELYSSLIGCALAALLVVMHCKREKQGDLVLAQSNSNSL